MQCSEDDSEQEALMTTESYADHLESAVRYALSTTHAIAVWPKRPWNVWVCATIGATAMLAFGGRISVGDEKD
jgi:hypothetical protein